MHTFFLSNYEFKFLTRSATDIQKNMFKIHLQFTILLSRFINSMCGSKMKICSTKSRYLRNECLFFSVHGIWIAVRNKQIAWTAKRFSCDLFVPHCDSYPMNREKKDTHSLYLQCLQQRPLLKFSEQSKKFKFPAEIGHLTLFPDKTIIAYSFRQNSAWINGEKVVCCECFHTLKQY